MRMLKPSAQVFLARIVFPYEMGAAAMARSAEMNSCGPGLTLEMVMVVT